MKAKEEEKILQPHEWTNGGDEVLIVRYCAHNGSAHNGFKHAAAVSTAGLGACALVKVKKLIGLRSGKCTESKQRTLSVNSKAAVSVSFALALFAS
jgi:hypothetical protein